MLEKVPGKITQIFARLQNLLWFDPQRARSHDSVDAIYLQIIHESTRFKGTLEAADDDCGVCAGRKSLR